MDEPADPPGVEPLFPKLAPRKNARRKSVVAHQRARLHAAMIEACARHGFATTTVRELVALAGVSSKTLYVQFESKEACFFATYDLVVQQAMARISKAYRGNGAAGAAGWDDGLCRAFEAFAAELVERPAPSRLALIEILAVKPDAGKRIERSEVLFARMISTSLAQAPDAAPIPPKLVRALVGGIWFVARARFLAGRAETIADGGAELREWLLAYRSAAVAQLSAAAPRRPKPAIGRGGAPDGSVRAQLLQAAATTVAQGGYTALLPAYVAGAAGVTERDLLAEFDDTLDLFLATLDWLSARALAEALREGRDAPGWAAGVCRAIEVIFTRLARDDALARAAFLDAFHAGPRGNDRLNAIIGGFADALVRRAPADRRPTPLVAEAIAGSVWSVADRHIAQGRRELLPASAGHAAFLALAPIIGADAAVRAIVDERGSRAPSRERSRVRLGGELPAANPEHPATTPSPRR